MTKRFRNLPITLVVALCLWGTMAHGTGVVLNEFMAKNQDTITNNEGASDSDWVEIYNGTTSNTNLAGWRLTDDASQPGKWRFPATNLNAGGFVLVWCDGITNSVTNGELHASFKLSSSAGSYLAFLTSNKVMVTEYTYPQQGTGISYGLGSNSEFRYFSHPTPGATNDFTSASNSVADTKFSVDRGFYTNGFLLAITTATTNAQIWYTTDGSAPSTNGGSSVLYTNAISISSTTVIRAAAFLDGFLPTSPDTQTYIFPSDVIRQPSWAPGPGWPPAGLWGTNQQVIDYGMDPNIVNCPAYSNQMIDALVALPAVSLVTPLTNLFDTNFGLYVNAIYDGSNWERSASVELIYPDGTTGFHVDCGFRMRGGYSREPWNPKHAFRLFFRQEYGPTKLNYPIFGDEGANSFDKIDLTTSENYGWATEGSRFNTMVRDQVDEGAMLRMGELSTRMKYCHLYLNGRYWGLYWFQERPEAAFAATYLGGNKADYDVMKVDAGIGLAYTNEATDGDSTAYERLWSAATNGFISLADYSHVQGLNSDGSRNTNYENLVDVDNLADYMVSIYYSQDSDEPISWYFGGGLFDQEQSQNPTNLFLLNNVYAIRDRTGAHGGFRFLIHDAEHVYDVGLASYGITNMCVTLVNPATLLFRFFNPEWLHQQMVSNAEYRLKFADHAYKRLFNNGEITAASLLTNMTMWASQINTAIIAESARWGDARVRPGRTKLDWEFAINSVSNFFAGGSSTALIMQQFKDRGWYPAIDPPGFNQEGGSFSNGFVLGLSSTNMIYYTVDGSDPRQYGTSAARGTVYTNSVGVVLRRNTHVMARARAGADLWSAMHEAVFTLADVSPLRVTEVMYHPRDPQGSETNGGYGDGAFEFIELLNVGTQTVGLAGLKFVNGVAFDFTSETNIMSLGAGQYMLLVGNLDAFKARYSNWGTMNIAGEFEYPANGLNNGGEKVALVDGLGRQVSSFTYSDWYPATDGAGHSLVPLVTAYQTNNVLDYKGNWRPSTYIDGSPGVVDPPPVATNIVFNEIMAHTDYNTNLPPEYNSDDWIELYNTAATNITFGNYWYLSSDPSDLKQWQIPATNRVLLHAWRVFDEISDFHVGGTNGTATNGFGLSKLGDMLFLSYLPGNSSDRVVDAKSFNGQERDKSYGRYPDGNADWYQMAITKGSSNSLLATQEIVISEVIYHPKPTMENPENNENDEYIELYNPSSSAVTLDTPAEGGPWQIDGGAQYTFPSNTVIPAGGYIVVVPFNPTNNVEASNDFCVAYGLTNGQVRMFGGFKGHLDNEIDRIALERPVAPDLPGEPQGWFEVDEVKYWDQSPWPLGVDGTGKPLQRKMNRASGNDPTNWAAGFVATPGYATAKIAITNPANESVFLVPFSVYVGADVDYASVSGAVRWVEFWDGAVRLNIDTNAPYGFTSSTITNAGTHYLTAILVDSNGATASPRVSMTVYTNAPSTDAGKNQRINITVDNGLGMDGTVAYNGVPTQQVSTTWSVVSGPAGATFGDASNLTTTVSFSWPGTYVLCLTTVFDNFMVSNDYVTVTVVTANSLNQIPYWESFEEYVDGSRLNGINGWYAPDPSVAVVEATNYTASYSNSYPITGPHELVLAIDGSVTNIFWNGASYSNTWVDLIMECRQWTDTALPVVGTDVQFAVYFTTNNHISVWHCQDPSNPPLGNIWTELPDTNIGSNQFIRLTVQGSYTREITNCFKFRLWVNATAVTNPATWYYTASTNNNYFGNVTAQGWFHMDDLVLADHDPFAWKEIWASIVGRGTITPAGSVLLPFNGTTNFTFAPATWYQRGNVVVDGTNNLGAITSYTFSNVVADHVIVANFIPDLAASNTPKWWLAQYYPATNFNSGATNDTDGDGDYGWQEYIAGTVPTNRASVFQISISRSNGQTVVTCPTVAGGTQYDGQNRYYTIETNGSLLVTGTWTRVNGWIDLVGDGSPIVFTNQFATNKPFYYRGKVRLGYN